ncbi:hypothetical protein [Poseidonibacter ostreae]|uniref:Uncharacterized protein n=1 Tax=Poseidonibacter ostreae TaxID=2654171 RepID=A0A6L4WXA5_9BACT|nr:hypothetical protein [Poseidonibacter ostreae]KAB7891383.1 hypothetical protein GBG19_00675 [Poseidonibacter ostreae]
MLRIRKNLNNDCSASASIIGTSKEDKRFLLHVKMKNILELIEFEKIDIESTFKTSEEYPCNFAEKAVGIYGKNISFKDLKEFCDKELESLNQNVNESNMKRRSKLAINKEIA